MAVELKIVSTGERAHRLLAAMERWTVVCRFQRSFYARSADKFLCVGRPDVGHGPLNVIVRPHASLDIGSCCAFNLSGAAIYGFSRWPTAREGTLAKDRLVAILQAAVAAAPAESFIRAMRPTLPEEPLSRKARIGMTALGTAIDASDTSVPFDPAVTALAGLGLGLTPSGDDVLAGALLMLHALGRTERTATLAGAVRRIAPSRTSPLSFALLEPACDGEANEAVTGAITALLAGQPPQAIIHHLASVGATSGFDILAGLLVAAGIRP